MVAPLKASELCGGIRWTVRTTIGRGAQAFTEEPKASLWSVFRARARPAQGFVKSSKLLSFFKICFGNKPRRLRL